MKMLIPWWIVTTVDWLAWPLGFQTNVLATSGSWGAERIFFVRRDPYAKRVKRLKPRPRET